MSRGPRRTRRITSQDEYRIKHLLTRMGEDPDRGGLIETPGRVLRALDEMTSGYNVKPKSVLKCFEDGAQGVAGMAFQGGITLWSLCEHHMLPFFGVAHIGYIPNGKVVGLSKLARLTDVFARRLQVQERLTKQIADALEEHLDPLGVGVVLQCRHVCMEARGVKRQGSVTTTTELRRSMMEHAGAREEFLAMVRTASQGHW